MLFRDRIQAGQLLAQRLKAASYPDPVVVALARGGVPIGFELSSELGAPLEVLVVRKIGAPGQPEFGIGAITEDGSYWLDNDSIHAIGASRAEIQEALDRERAEVERRVALYRKDRPFPSLRGKTAIVVDDGLATGVTARAAGLFLKRRGADRVVLAAPVCSSEAASLLRSELDEVLCLAEPRNFFSVGQFYEDFYQTTDDEVLALIARAGPRAPAGFAVREEALIHGRGIELPATLAIPSEARAAVIFAHGSGSGRLSPRNTEVAATLNEAGFATLLFDLLTEEESQDRSNVFDTSLLASRLLLATRWLKHRKAAKGLPLGYLGASTGAAAALWAASKLGNEISAVVSRGGRPDLAIPRLSRVTAPTLLLVGENDESVIELNQEAMKYLATSNLVIIPGATHLFEQPGALQAVARESIRWFSRYLNLDVRRADAS